MRATGTFTVKAFVPTELRPDPAVPTGLPVGVATMSGTGELAGIAGAGGMAVDADGTHRIWFDYQLG
ncbi:DUF3224 domain-containing protein [Streptomyces sp. NPDC041003]|uniref:DUF3224 domain-containing protein n=1 Tax=Streptomyces sp. NPDC041003 TaxID=3155730 RepID=UPI0033E9CADE